jgi:hypothetical protein
MESFGIIGFTPGVVALAKIIMLDKNSKNRIF